MRCVIAFLIGFLGILIPGLHAFVFCAELEHHYTDDNSAGYYNNLGIERFNAGDFEQAGKLFSKSLELKRLEQDSLSVDMASTYTNLGVVNRRLFNTEDAMLYYDSASYVYLNHHGPDHPMLGAVYQNQGNILRERRDIKSAISYYETALRIFIKNDMTAWVAGVYNNIGIANEMKGDYEKAKEFFFRSIDIREMTDPSAVAIPAGNLAICYKESGDLLMSDKYYRVALNAIGESRGKDNVHYATNLMNYGLFLITDADEPKRGYEMLLRALDIYRSVEGDKGQNISLAYMNLGYYYEVTGDLENALRYYHNSLIANSDTFMSTVIRENPGPEDRVFSLDYMLASLKHKAYALFLLSDNYDKRENLEASLDTYKAAMSFIRKIRMGHHTEESRILLLENEHDTYMRGVHVAWKLYELTAETVFFEDAFEFSERSKAASLLSSIRDVEARSFGGVPGELLINEQRLKKGIAAYRELIYEEQRNVDTDEEKISLWHEMVFSLEIELRQLIGRLEEEYPDYYTLKYDQRISDISKVKESIGTGNALVSYVYSDTLVYIFTITGSKSNFYCIKPENSPENKLEILLNVLTKGNLDVRVRDDYHNFIKSSHYFYNLLIDPVYSDIRGKRLVIVPDGMLAYVPFELLLSSGLKADDSNYRDLPYLLRDFPVSYSYSATLWQESLHKTYDIKNKMLAIAPLYEYSSIPLSEANINRQFYRDKLTPLPGAREEAVKVAELMNGEALLDNQATEYNFKQLAGDYQVLHLAMHTLIDDDSPMFSKLVFTESKNDEEDGLLNTYEIYNLRLNAGLAVLSSCRSGHGTLRRGEGVMSLARGFLYAGVPSIVMTSWEIEDKSGAEIMINFYKYLLKGYRKDEALRLARLDFLDNADMLRAHPYFWGAYVCIGNPDEIFSSYRQFYPPLTFLLLLLIMIIILWRGHIRRL